MLSHRCTARSRLLCAQVLLLSKGEVVEYGPPLELLTKEGGALRELAAETGDLHGLISMAREAAQEQVAAAGEGRADEQRIESGLMSREFDEDEWAHAD